MGEREAGCACALNDIWFGAAVGKLEWELQLEVPVYQNYPQGLGRGIEIISIKKLGMYRCQAIWESVKKTQWFWAILCSKKSPEVILNIGTENYIFRLRYFDER